MLKKPETGTTNYVDEDKTSLEITTSLYALNMNKNVIENHYKSDHFLVSGIENIEILKNDQKYVKTCMILFKYYRNRKKYDD